MLPPAPGGLWGWGRTGARGRAGREGWSTLGVRPALARPFSFPGLCNGCEMEEAGLRHWVCTYIHGPWAGAQDNPVQTFLQGREDVIGRARAIQGNRPLPPPGSPVLGAGRPEKGPASPGEKPGIGGRTKSHESWVQSWLCGHGELLPLWASVFPPVRGRCPFRILPQGLLQLRPSPSL